ncbi:ZIP zinc transporter-domain-containing protein [Apodospora peruviana]|uniref:ZIP zinc transporter-domain-containing protein n=1 Tax=Apodospora peruviana TaxID=516989 RepID=A0AAE0I752_9PEZI|nr:ZIP zinc transporter-domain-containing protein [Apodospora peruviana]
MNRPSRTEDDLEHPGWNQMPAFLAPDLTTRQDLNGIVNARAQRSRCSGTAEDSSGFIGDKSFDDSGRLDARNYYPPPNTKLAMNGCIVSQPFIAPRTMLGGEGQARRFLSSTRPRWTDSDKVWGWVWWFLSVLATATIINMAGNLFPAMSLTKAPSTVTGATSPKSIMSHLAKRADSNNACATKGVSPSEYNVPLHVGALLIILGVSSLACATPLMATKFPILRIPERVLFAVRHFGTGVLLATAFVHLLPTAFISLGNPCLSSFWTTDYPAMPGAIALFGIFFVTIIEMVLSPVRQFTPRAEKQGKSRSRSGDREGEQREGRPAAVRVEAKPPVAGGGHCSHSAVVAAVARPRRESGAVQPAGLQPAHSASSLLREESQNEHHVLTPEQLHKKSILQCMLLEVGILFHSVFIGMALSVAVGGNFVVLLIAIAFHQTFEGLALGARIASIEWPEKSLQPWLMVLAYGCTTPAGQAIGLATHSLYSPDSEFGLILVGTMNAVSSGLLVFASLIELLAEDFLSDHSWAVLRGKRRVVACLLVLFGAICMSLVGAWA